MKKIISILPVLACLMGLFSGCTAVEKPTEVSVAHTAAPSSVRSDIVIASGYDILSLDPQETNDIYSFEIMNMIYERLLATDGDGNIVPSLAESWEIADDTQYIFHLRKGVKFHNGAELTADDVVFTLERAMTKPLCSPALEKVKSVRALAEYSVEICTTEPFSPLLRNLTTMQTAILSRQAVTEKGGVIDVSPVGTGPMVLDEYKANYSCRVARFDDYWGPKATSASVTRMVIPDDSARTIALEKGEVDYVGTVPVVDIERIKANSDLKTRETDSSNVAYMAFNMEKAPFDDVRVRQALHFATDKCKIIDSLYEGYGTECKSIFPTNMQGYNSSLDLYPFSLERAESLLFAAGYPDGFSMEIAVSSDSRSRMAQMIQSDFKEIGVRVSINQMEFGAFLDYLDSDRHEGFIMSWTGSSNHDMTVTTNFHSQGDNRMHYGDDEVDKLIEKARGIIEWDKREPLYKEIQKLVMADCAWIPILQEKYVIGMCRGLTKIEPEHNNSDRSGYIDFVVEE